MTNDDDAKRALVVGLGQTGLSCVRYLRARGYAVSVVDSRRDPPARSELAAAFADVPLHAGGFDDRCFAGMDLVVVSPGVSVREPAIVRARAAGAEIVGDVELFAREMARLNRPVVAITGANGKSTVTSLVGAMCREAGMDVAVAGNIGLPVLSLLDGPVHDIYVLELSSFQLETTSSLAPVVAAVLNVTADHMDRYANFGEYAAAKARVFAGFGVMVLNREDPAVMAMAQVGRVAVRFGLLPPESDSDLGLVTHAGEEWLARGEQLLFSAAEVPLPGRHNLANVLAATALAQAAGVPIEAVRRAVRQFEGLAHRTALVAERAGIQWIDDSKGTNVGATVAALNGMPGRVILIAGGDGKGADFGPLKAAVAAHCRAVVLIGRDAPLIAAALGDAAPLHRAASMTEAVRQARSLARAGDVVLLSPACASFDMFRNYIHRGEVFAQAVREALDATEGSA